MGHRFDMLFDLDTGRKKLPAAALAPQPKVDPHPQKGKLAAAAGVGLFHIQFVTNAKLHAAPPLFFPYYTGKTRAFQGYAPNLRHIDKGD